jgi:predicted DNA-binding protein
MFVKSILNYKRGSMALKQLNIKIPEQELKILEALSAKTERTKTDLIREFIRSLQAKV